MILFFGKNKHSFVFVVRKLFDASTVENGMKKEMKWNVDNWKQNWK